MKSSFRIIAVVICLLCAALWYQQHRYTQKTAGQLAGQTNAHIENSNALSKDTKSWVGQLPQQPSLANQFLYGYGREQDIPRAVSLLEAAANNGDIDAMAVLGALYYEGKAPEGVNLDKAVALLEPASKQGHSHAKTTLAWLYYEGSGVEQDYQKSAALYQSAADDGYPYAMAALGWMYQFGLGVEKDINKAIELLENAANLGNGHAQVSLGEMYSKGEHLPKDPEKAKHWFTIASFQGNPAAIAYLKGEKPPSSYTE